MTRRTQEQIQADKDEAQYIGWIMTEGPARAEARNKELAEASIIELENAGYKVLSREMKRGFMEEYNKMEIVVRKGDAVKILQWNSFNKGWMQRAETGGSFIFKIGRD